MNLCSVVRREPLLKRYRQQPPDRKAHNCPNMPPAGSIRPIGVPQLREPVAGSNKAKDCAVGLDTQAVAG